MLKPLIKLLLFTALIYTTPVYAQQSYLQKYIGTGLNIRYSPVNFLTDQRFYEARHMSDTLNVEITKAEDVQSLVDLHLNQKVFGVSLRADSAHITEAVAALKNFPQLKFILFNEGPIFVERSKPLLLPEGIKQLQQLEGVALSFTGINIPDALKKLTALPKLQAIAFNPINNTAVTNTLLALKNIRYIRISGSDINNLDLSNLKWEYVEYGGSAPKTGIDEKALQKLSAVKSLKSLKISYYELGDDLSVLSKFTQLNSLEILATKNKSKAQIFEQLGNLTNLTSLSIRHYRDSVQTLNGIEKLVNLQQLNLDGFTLVKAVPAQIYNLPKLKSLTMQGFEFTDLPAGVFNIPNLEYLDLSANKLATLPDGKFTSTKLKTLKLDYNGIGALPNAILSLTNLEYLNALSNKISSLPASGWDALQHLKEVDLSTNRIQTFPDGLQQIAGLEKLNLNSNNISTIPDLKGGNYQLKQLDLSMNNLVNLPAHIGKYTKLEMLNISGNRLSSLPESIGDCVNLKNLDAHTESRTRSFDVNKTGDTQFGITKLDTSKYNHITTLPVGLKNTPQLEDLRLDGNQITDAGSVFDVILAMPRQYLNVNLSNNRITEIPASGKWADIALGGLELGNNKITALPAQFAAVKRVGRLSLYKNPLPVDQALINNDINTKGDLKILYEEMGVSLPGLSVSDKEYATALTKRIGGFNDKNQWQKAVDYANKAIRIDSVAYNNNVRWDEIGISRMHIRDYAGAIKDFDRFIAKDVKQNVRILNFSEPVGRYKVQAYLALGQVEKAAETYEFFAKNYGTSGNLQRAALLYKQLGRDDKYRQLLDSAIAGFKRGLDFQIKQKRTDISQILDYSETLIVAGKAAEAVKLINDQDPKYYTDKYVSIKSYLLATANYLENPNQYEQFKKELTTNINTYGKITGWDFDMFNNWVEQTIKDPIKKSQITALQNIAK